MWIRRDRYVELLDRLHKLETERAAARTEHQAIMLELQRMLNRFRMAVNRAEKAREDAPGTTNGDREGIYTHPDRLDQLIASRKGF